MEIIKEFQHLKTLDHESQCNLFNRLYSNLQKSTVLQTQALLIRLEVIQLELPEDQIKTITELQQKVIDKVHELTPFKNLRMTGLAFQTKSEVINNVNVDNALRDFLIARFNKMEKDHIIFEVESALADTENQTFPFFEKIMLDCATGVNNVKPKYLTTFIEPKHISKRLLIKMSEYPEFCNDFFMALFLHKNEKYNLFIDRIFNLNYRLSPVIMNSLINIKFENVPVYSFEVFSYFITYQPKIKQKIIDKCKTIKKTVLLNLVTAHFDFFKDSCSEFNLTFNDLIFCAKTETSILYFLLTDQNYLENFNFTTFLTLLQTMEEQAISEFFTNIIVDQKEQNTGKRREVLEHLFLIYIKDGKKITESIQSLLTSVFLDSEKYFLTLIDYIWKPIILTYQECYLANEETLEIFLRQLTPIDILHKIHEYKDLKKAVQASKLCFEKKNIFNSEVLTQTILLLESTMPILTMRTVLFTLINYEHTDNVITGFLIRSNKKIFEKQDNIIGLIRCLNTLKGKSLEILPTMEYNQIKRVLSDAELCSIVEREIQENGNDPKFVEVLKALRSLGR